MSFFRDLELDALERMSEAWHPGFAEHQGFRRQARRVGGFEERRAGQRAREGVYPAAMTPPTQPHQQQLAHR